jgi:hypothetical protein
MTRKGTDAAKDVYCEWEAARFPARLFDRHEAYGMIHVRGLEKGTPPHTIAGDRLPEAGQSARGGGGEAGVGDRRTYHPSYWAK